SFLSSFCEYYFIFIFVWFFLFIWEHCMRRNKVVNLFPLDLEIDRTLRSIRRDKRLAEAMAHQEEAPKAIRDFLQPVLPTENSGIIYAPIQATNFELKTGLIQMARDNSFKGHPSEDPHSHLRSFLEICGTVKMNGVPADAIRLRLFPFSLQDKAKDWLESVETGNISTWDELAQAFLTKFFPPAKTTKLRTEIGTFRQLNEEQFYEAWERYKEMLR
ncbi:retrotransposon gag domain-containing protein, partial [Salmonella enterica]|nr:retrotransposon gag domain-containing protein [Salmonella enterica]